MGLVETIRHDFHFPGHALPGIAFLLMGSWWIKNILYIYARQHTNSYAIEIDTEITTLVPKKSIQQASSNNDQELSTKSFTPFYTATYNGKGRSILCCEGFYKLLYASFDLFCHILVIFNGSSLTDEAQHITVYLFFIFNALIDIQLYKQQQNNSTSTSTIPIGTDYVISGLTWPIGFGFLFLSHKHAKTEIQIYYHQLLGWIANAVGIFTLIQYKYPRNVLVALLRAITCVLVGTWLFQIAFTFHNPWILQAGQASEPGSNLVTATNMHGPFKTAMAVQEESLDTIMQVMMAATYFSWHVLVVTAFTFGYGIIYIRNLTRNGYYQEILKVEKEEVEEFV